jgi:hypothetical protein
MTKCKTEGCPNELGVAPGRRRKYCSALCKQRDYNRRDFLAKPKKWMYWSVYQSAQQKGLEFTITVDDIPEVPKVCPVFPWLELERPTGKGRKFHANAPSVDRINPNIGYVPGNLRIISWRANALRSNGTLEEMEHIVADLKRIEAVASGSGVSGSSVKDKEE